MKTNYYPNGFNDFIRYCKAKNLEDGSLHHYNQSFDYFCLSLPKDKNGFPKDIQCSEINQNTVYSFIEFLKNRNQNISAITINSYLRGVRALLYYFMEMGYTQHFRIHLLRAQKALKNIYTDSELNILLRKPNIKKCSFLEYRNWVMVNYELSTGNRLRTVVNLKNEDLLFDSNLIALKVTKNKKQQLIPMSPALKNVLSEYVTYRKGKPEDYLFCNRYGKQLTTRGLYRAISTYNRKRGVNKTAVKLFRHTFATKFLENGGDSLDLQEHLGHCDIKVTKEYLHFTAQHLKKNIENINPLDVLNNGSKSELIKMKK